MLPKPLRLPLKTQKTQLRLSGKRIPGKYLTLIYKQTPQATPRLAVVVSKKIAPNAVDRNHLKRQLTQVAFPLIKNNNQGCDLLVLPQKTALTTSWNELKQDLEDVIRKACLEN